MTEHSTDEAVTDSGGVMRRLTEPPTDAVPDLALLEPLRRTAYDAPMQPAGQSPFFPEGAVITWHYGLSVDTARVVRDDERGLVAWLPSGSESLLSTPRDGRGLRDLPLAERFSAPRHFVVRRWQGPGVIRIAPTGVPWSIWYFFDEAGSFEGHYYNLELTHRRPVDASPRIHTRDLILDLWVGDGGTWLKDADELEAMVSIGRYSSEQADVVRDIAEQTRRQQIEPSAWPLDEGWETWWPTPEWDEPLSLPQAAVDAVSKTGEPVRRPGTNS